MLLSVVAVALLAAAGGLLLWTLVPMLFGWSSSVVVSGSMHPAVEAGDVVVTAPVPAARIRAGYVIRFRDPSRPGRAVLHRIVRIDERGRLVTKGDANRVEDAVPVPVGAVTGRGRLRVPYIGLPALWWIRHEYLKVLVTFVALAGLCALAWTGRRPVASRRSDGGAARWIRSRRSGPRPS